MYRNELIDIISEVSNLESVRSRKRIIRADEKLNKIAFIDEGKFNVLLKTQDGNRKIVYQLSSIENDLIVFPEQFMNRSIKFDVIALTDSSIRWISLLDFNKLSKNNNLMTLKLFKALEHCNIKMLEVLLNLKKESLYTKPYLK